jgi:hypothetical protein
MIKLSFLMIVFIANLLEEQPIKVEDVEEHLIDDTIRFVQRAVTIIIVQACKLVNEIVTCILKRRHRPHRQYLL